MSRIIGYPEFLGRVLDIVNGAEDTQYRPPARAQRCVYFWDGQPSCLHGHVLDAWGLSSGQDEIPDGESAAELYKQMGMRLSPRARSLAQISQGAQDSGSPWGVSVRLGQRRALRTAATTDDQQVGDVTVVETVTHLAHTCGFSVRTSPDALGDSAPRLVDHGVPVSLVGYACAAWGISPPDWGGNEQTSAVEALLAIGWHVSPRASALLVSAQEAEKVGHSWGEIARMLATLNVTAEVGEEVDR